MEELRVVFWVDLLQLDVLNTHLHTDWVSNRIIGMQGIDLGSPDDINTDSFFKKSTFDDIRDVLNVDSEPD